MTRNWGWALDNSQEETEALSPTTCKELNPTHNHMSLEVDPSHLEPQGTQPLLTLR